MAYKFQIGAAVLSGSIKAEDGLVATDVDDTTAANIVAQIDDGEIAFSKLASLTSANILVGNASNKPAGVAMSGDIAISNAGLTTIQANAVEGTMLDANVADDSSIELVSSELRLKDNGVTLAKMAGLADGKFILGSAGGDPAAVSMSGDATMANNGLLTIAANAVEGTMLDANVADDSSIELVSNALRVKAAGITNSMLADDAVGADELASNAVVDASVAAGAAILASKINFNTDLGGNISFGNQADDDVTFGGGVVVAGNLTVQGSTTTVDSTTINISSSFTFEGPADDHETILTCATPGADTTLSLPTLSAGSYFIPAIAGAATDASAAVTAAEFALLDGASSVGNVTLLDGDGFLHNDGGVMKHTEVSKIVDLAFGKTSGDVVIAANGAATIQADAVESSMLNDNIISGQTALASGLVGTDELMISDAGTIKRMGVSVLKSFIGGGSYAVQAIGDANATLAIGLNAPNANATASRTWTLPASSGLSAGDSIVIKAYANAGAQPLTIALAGSQEVDGSTSNFILESDNAAVTLYYIATDVFVIV